MHVFIMYIENKSFEFIITICVFVFYLRMLILRVTKGKYVTDLCFAQILFVFNFDYMYVK